MAWERTNRALNEFWFPFSGIGKHGWGDGPIVIYLIVRGIIKLSDDFAFLRNHLKVSVMIIANRFRIAFSSEAFTELPLFEVHESFRCDVYLACCQIDASAGLLAASLGTRAALFEASQIDPRFHL